MSPSFSKSTQLDIPYMELQSRLVQSQKLFFDFDILEGTSFAAGQLLLLPHDQAKNYTIRVDLKRSGNQTDLYVVVKGQDASAQGAKVFEQIRSIFTKIASKALKPPEPTPHASQTALHLSVGRSYIVRDRLPCEDGAEIKAGEKIRYIGDEVIPYDAKVFYRFEASGGRKWSFEGSPSVLALLISEED